ncbi:SAF domain-containing protein [Streptomyces chartreusis]
MGISDPLPPRQRSRARMLGGAMMVICGAIGVTWLLNGMTDRQDVLAVARDVPVGQQITVEDLRVVALPDDPALHPIEARERDSIVGRRTSARLVAGSLLTEGQLATGSALREGEELVAVEVKRGMAPVDALEVSDTVRIVTAPEEGTKPSGTGTQQEQAEEATGRVVKVGQPDTSGSTVVQIAVPKADSSQVAARAASGDVALVLAAKG